MVVALVIGWLATAALLAWQAIAGGAARRRMRQTVERAAHMEAHTAALQARVDRLARYEVVADAEAAAAAIRAQAADWASRTTDQARREAGAVAAEGRDAATRAQAAADVFRAETDAWAASTRTQANEWARQTTDQARRDAAGALAQGREAAAKIQGAAHEYRAEVETWAASTRAQLDEWARQTTEQARRDAAAILAEGREAATKLQAAANQHRAEAETWAASTRAEATAYKEQVTAQALAQGEDIVGQATTRAKEIAGDAMVAVRDAKRFEQTAAAMRNVIEGYGDRYLMPSAGLLDDLAEEMGFVEAGQQLKAARQRTRQMIKQGTAATCDYVEANRRATAIEFVLDAFNGKVDTILADVRHDNFGTLQQKIRDAEVLVNHNGRAFRDARILGAYVDARLEELRWAVTATELKNRARDEQRAMKERIRDEERAQREFEKALREAQKEEELIRKAMAKARQEVEQSSEAERERLEAKLAELGEKLRSAEEKNQRAVSMAQQTKSGHVYVISNIGSFGEHVFKIGLTRRLEPLERIHELGDASVPFEFDVHALLASEDAPALERSLHQRFRFSQVNKVNARKEFFRVPLAEIRQGIEDLGVAAAWTMHAEARQYRETLAVERALATKTLDEAAWAKQQAAQEESGVVEVGPAERSFAESAA